MKQAHHEYRRSSPDTGKKGRSKISGQVTPLLQLQRQTIYGNIKNFYQGKSSVKSKFLSTIFYSIYICIKSVNIK